MARKIPRLCRIRRRSYWAEFWPARVEKTAVLAMGTPYLTEDFPTIQNYICTFSNANVSEVSAAKALFGEIPIAGHLPVNISKGPYRAQESNNRHEWQPWDCAISCHFSCKSSLPQTRLEILASETVRHSSPIFSSSTCVRWYSRSWALPIETRGLRWSIGLAIGLLKPRESHSRRYAR